MNPQPPVMRTLAMMRGCWDRTGVEGKREEDPPFGVAPAESIEYDRPMNGIRAIWAWGGAMLFAAAALAAEPAAAPTPLLTLSTPALRAGMERLSLAWLFPAQAPDVRLKIERPTLAELSTWEADPRVRGVEFRLPQTGIWMGYEAPVEGELPRATLSIQRGF